MKPEILKKLAEISEEERNILSGEQQINKRLYSAVAKEFIGK